MAAKVPSTVERMLAQTAMIMVFTSESIITLLWNSFVYHLRVKPV